MTFDPYQDHADHPNDSMERATLRLVRAAKAACVSPTGFKYMLADEEDLHDIDPLTDALDGALYYLEQTVRETEDVPYIPEDRRFTFEGQAVDIAQFIEDEGFAMPDIEQIGALGVDDYITYDGTDGVTPGVLRRIA